MTKITSSFLSLDLRDCIQGLLMAASGAAFGVITGSLNAGSFTFDWTAIWHAALVASSAYLGKKLFTPAQAIKPVQQ